MSFAYKYRYWIGTAILVGIISVYFIASRRKGLGRGAKVKNANPKKILFVGDSVTAIKDYRTGKPITSTYPNFVKQQLEPKGIKVDVLAKGGETTKWMLENLPIQLASSKYDRIYVYGGINDAWNNSITPEKTMQNVNAIIDAIKQSGADAFIIQGYEPIGFMDYKKMPVTRYQKANTDNIPLINEYIAYQDSLSKLQSQRRDFNLIPKVDLGSRTGDGIHPNGEGQRLLADAILKSIAK